MMPKRRPGGQTNPPDYYGKFFKTLGERHEYLEAVRRDGRHVREESFRRPERGLFALVERRRAG